MSADDDSSQDSLADGSQFSQRYTLGSNVFNNPCLFFRSLYILYAKLKSILIIKIVFHIAEVTSHSILKGNLEKAFLQVSCKPLTYSMLKSPFCTGAVLLITRVWNRSKHTVRGLIQRHG